MIIRHKPYIINKTKYVLLPKKLAQINEFDVREPFLLQILEPKKTKKYYFNECKDISGADYVAITKVLQDNEINSDQEIEFFVENV